MSFYHSIDAHDNVLSFTHHTIKAFNFSHRHLVEGKVRFISSQASGQHKAINYNEDIYIRIGAMRSYYLIKSTRKLQKGLLLC